MHLHVSAVPKPSILHESTRITCSCARKPLVYNGSVLREEVTARTYLADECFSFVNADGWIQPLDVKSFACCRWFHMRNPNEEISNVMQSDPAYGELFDARGLEDLLR